MALGPHQEAFAKTLYKEWQRDPSYSILLGDRAGLGKTRMALAALEKRCNMSDKRIQCLIICPLNQTRFWVDEAKIVCPSMKPDTAFAFHNVKREQQEWHMSKEPRLVFTTISTLGSEYARCASVHSEYDMVDESEHGPVLSDIQRQQSMLYDRDFDTVIIDEPTYLCRPFWKAQKTQHAPACYNLSYECCILLNADPLRNRLSDLSGQLYMLRRAPANTREWWKGCDDISHVSERIRDSLHVYIYRSSTDMCPQLSVSLETEDIPIPFSSVQIELLKMCKNEANRFRQQWEEKTASVSVTRRHLLSKMNEMFLISLAPQLVAQNYLHMKESTNAEEVDDTLSTWTIEDAPSYCFLVRELIPSIMKRNTPGSQILVFSRYRVSLDLLSDFLQSEWPNEFKQPCLSLGGPSLRGKKQNRQETLKLFRENVSEHALRLKPWHQRCLFLTYHFARGLNLQQAAHVIKMDEPWTPDASDQAVRRSYRKGQTCDVTVYRLMREDPCAPDHFIRRHLKKKRQIIERTGLATTHSNEKDEQDDSITNELDHLSVEDLCDFLFAMDEEKIECTENVEVVKKEKVENELTKEEYYFGSATSNIPSVSEPVSCATIPTQLQRWTFQNLIPLSQ